jgi:hypothetical protein
MKHTFWISFDGRCPASKLSSFSSDWIRVQAIMIPIELRKQVRTSTKQKQEKVKKAMK